MGVFEGAQMNPSFGGIIFMFLIEFMDKYFMISLATAGVNTGGAICCHSVILLVSPNMCIWLVKQGRNEAAIEAGQ